MLKKCLWAAALATSLTACEVQDGQYVTHGLDTSGQADAQKATVPAEVEILEGTPDRSFVRVGDIEMNVSKLTAFHQDPSREDTLDRLKQEAANLGADAVINVSVSEPKVVLTS